MQEQPDLKPRRAQVVVHLPLGRLVQLERGLGLDEYALVDDHVDALSRNLITLVEHGHVDLSTDSMALDSQVPLERRHVYLLEKPEAERVVHVVERADDRMSQLRLD